MVCTIDCPTFIALVDKNIIDFCVFLYREKGCGTTQIANNESTTVFVERSCNICMAVRTNWPVCTFNESSGKFAHALIWCSIVYS